MRFTAFKALLVHTLGAAAFAAAELRPEVRKRASQRHATLPVEEAPSMASVAEEFTAALGGDEAFELGLAALLEDVLSKGLLIDRSTRVPSTARASCQRPRIPYGRKRRRVLPVDRGGKAKMRLACQKTISREGRSSRLVVTARSQPRTGFAARKPVPKAVPSSISVAY